MENNKEYNIGSKLLMKKQHPCGGNIWQVKRVGADIKIECTTCGRIVLIPRIDLNKRIKKVLSEEGK
ncbi:MAG: DUF951 domain-containing protein [Bacilli bacterium]|nr:DUF951 domain-containing protein [Bacilli bacterium]